MSHARLHPGMMFKTPGHREHSTPGGIQRKKEDIQSLTKKAPYDPGEKWPTDSPMAERYDISRTHTGLVLTNADGKYGNRLRGQKGENYERNIDPNRHNTGRVSSAVQPEESSQPQTSATPLGPPRCASAATSRRPLVALSSDGGSRKGGSRDKKGGRPLAPPTLVRQSWLIPSLGLSRCQTEMVHDLARVYSVKSLQRNNQITYMRELQKQRELWAVYSSDQPGLVHKYHNALHTPRTLPFQDNQAKRPMSVRVSSGSPRAARRPKTARPRGKRGQLANQPTAVEDYNDIEIPQDPSDPESKRQEEQMPGSHARIQLEPSAVKQTPPSSAHDPAAETERPVGVTLNTAELSATAKTKSSTENLRPSSASTKQETPA